MLSYFKIMLYNIILLTAMALSLEELNKEAKENPQHSAEYRAKRKYYLKNKERINEYMKDYMREYMREHRKKKYCNVCDKEILHLERHLLTATHAKKESQL